MLGYIAENLVVNIEDFLLGADHDLDNVVKAATMSGQYLSEEEQQGCNNVRMHLLPFVNVDIGIGSR